jgi:hypothetical protein
MLAQLRCLSDDTAVPVADGLPAALAAAARPPVPARRLGTIAAGDPRAGVVGVTAVSDEQELSHILAGVGKGEGLVRFIRDWLGALLDYDVEHRSDLVKTLSVYLDCGGDYDAGARVLGIHRSTLRYRIHLIRALAGHDLGDACIWLNLHAATRALATHRCERPVRRRCCSEQPGLARSTGHVQCGHLCSFRRGGSTAARGQQIGVARA